MDGEDLQELRSYLDNRLGNIDRSLTVLHDRVTVNAEERLEEVKRLHQSLDNHIKRNHGGGSTGAIKKGGIGAVLASAAYALFEMIKRMS